jgi:hypothetical protein
VIGFAQVRAAGGAPQVGQLLAQDENLREEHDAGAEDGRQGARMVLRISMSILARTAPRGDRSMNPGEYPAPVDLAPSSWGELWVNIPAWKAVS